MEVAMQRLLALVVVGALTMTVSIMGLGVPAAEACTIECIALGLAAFAVFNQLVGVLTVPRVAYGPPYYPGYYYPPGYYGAPQGAYPSTYSAAYAAPAPSSRPAVVNPDPTVVYYAHGRYELRGDGLGSPYTWVWISNARSSSGVSAAYVPPSRPVVANPAPTVVYHPQGRYELHGDGLRTPYTWVWIPNAASSPVVTALPLTVEARAY
jgi:hypothetical protein